MVIRLEGLSSSEARTVGRSKTSKKFIGRKPAEMTKRSQISEGLELFDPKF